MIRLKDTRYSSTADFLSSAIRIAEYYGFSNIEELPRAVLDKYRPLPVAKVESEISLARRDERALLSAASKCLARLERGATLLAWRTTAGTSGIPSISFELHIVGPSSAISEALLIIVGDAIADEAGIPERTLSINNIGSAESSNRFVRDVGLYLRKHIESISPTLRPRAASDPLGTLIQLIERRHPASPRAPQPMEYLTEEERRRFWELLEYIEMFGLPYELDAHILGSRDCWAHSLFEISSLDQESGVSVPVAAGGRYDPLMSRFARTPLSAATIAISCEIRGKTRPVRSRGMHRSNNEGGTSNGARVRREPEKAQGGIQPAIYFAHLGTEARRRALSVLENLRHAGVAVHQGIWHEKIGEQMVAARRLATPYILIMGHKEAMEGTILVREVATNSQDAIPLPELPNYLKRRRVGIGHETRA